MTARTDDTADEDRDEAIEAWIGETGETCFATQPVNRSMIQFYASMVEDGNPTYWDPEFAADQWGDICSPPAMLITWKMAPMWSPEPLPATEGDISGGDVPVPGDKNLMTKTRTKVHRPIVEGTWLNWQTEITDVSAEKETHLGPGHFVESTTRYRNAHGDLIAEDVNHLLRYTEADDGGEDGDGSEKFDSPMIDGRRTVEADDRRPDDRYSSVDPTTVSAGDAVEGYEFPVTFRKVIHNVAATRDFYPVHHDPAFARSSGTETVFLNTMALQGLVDRLALQWAGPEWRIADRTISMRGSALAGTKLEVSGTVEDVDPAADRIDIDVDITDANGEDVCPSSVTITRG